MRRALTKIALLAALAFQPHAALAVDTVTSKESPQLGAVRVKIDAKDWAGAVADLKTLSATYQHADVYNLLGYSLRNMGDYPQARTYYAKALDFDPNHRGAHEYLGELYIKTGEIDKAKAMVVKLEILCPGGCEELADLKKDVAEATGSKTN
jgi:Flp pilus assembly protein TadD